MIWHELRRKPIPLWLALCLSGSACEVQETIWKKSPRVTLTQGRAVTPWLDTQTLIRDDASADAAHSDAEASDAAVSDAAMSDAELSDAAIDDAAVSDAAPDAANGAAALDPFQGIDKRCVFRVTLLPLGGRYAPRNIGAIWIAHRDGTWVKTLALWAGVRIRYLTAYRSANPTGNKVDAVTSATQSMVSQHVVGWNLDDANHGEVPDGEYQVEVEVTDRDAMGERLTFPFMKTQPPFRSMVSNMDYFSDAELRCR